MTNLGETLRLSEVTVKSRLVAAVVDASLLVAITTGCVGCGESSAPHPRNVVLISIDSLRADHLHCYGYEAKTSPTIDALAAAGVRFAETIAESPWTLPSHATLMTGLSQGVHEAGFGGQRIPDGADTLAEILGREGFESHGVWSGPFLHPFFGFAQGFAEGGYRSALGDIGYDKEAISTERMADRDRMTNVHQLAHSGNTSRQVADEGIRFLAGRKGDAPPFFLFLHFFDVHFDYVPPEPYWRTFDPDYHGDFDPVDFAQNSHVNSDIAPRDLQHLLARYDGEILFTDEHVGRVLDQLETLGLGDDTLVILTADHGEEFFEHGGKGHLNGLYEPLVRVPLVMTLPGVIPAATTVDELARHIDVAPTILDLLGIPVPSQMMGSSLVPLMRGAGVGAERVAVSRLVQGGGVTFTTLRSGTDKLYTGTVAGEDSAYRMYDLDADPHEAHLLHGPKVHDRLEALVLKLKRFEAREEALRDELKLDSSHVNEIPSDLAESLNQMGY